MKPIIKSQPNFRDLGGVKTKSGRTVRENIAFRSGFIGELNETDTSTLATLNVGLVIDLRTTEEIELTGNGNYPTSVEYQNIALNAGNISKHLIPVFQQGAFHLIEPTILDKIYADLITEFKPELSAIFRTIIHSKKAIVYHCSHGKDRTGIISALLLDFLEVDRVHIYEDYLKSNELLKTQNEFYIQKIKENFTQIFKRDVSEEEFAPVKTLFQCREGLLKIVFDYIDTEHGSVKNYFQTELGLKDEELILLTTNYLD